MILYVTYDGLLQPLGRSQVLRYVEGLTDRGWKFAVLSFEQEQDLADHTAVKALADALAARGIRWLFRPYRAGGARNVAQNVADGVALGLEFASEHDVQLTHARSYQAGLVALALRRALGVPYLFDMRGYWVDERREDGRWFTNPSALAAGRAAERALFRNAAGVVSLARPAADDIAAGRFGRWDKPLEVIPTCVDPAEFAPGAAPTELAPELRDRLVLGYVGSVNASYRIDASFQLAAYLCDLRDDAHVLCLTGQVDEVSKLLDRFRIPRLRRTVIRVPHDQMALWMRHIDWGLLLLNEPFAKRGSMPTKLGEFFATGVRPVAYGCNADVVDWVRRAGSGIVLQSCTPRSLRATAAKIAEAGKRPRDVDPVGDRAREITMPHFSAVSGVERYDELYRRVLRG